MAMSNTLAYLDMLTITAVISLILEAPEGQNCNLRLNDVYLVSIRHLWHPKTVVFLHRCLIQTVLFHRHKE
jgi:hypothetical protein